jgi:phosphoribosylanthranilate isomerase
MIAGGLTPENVGDCVRATRPFGVDVRSGVEADGRIDSKRVQQFVRAVRESDAA